MRNVTLTATLIAATLSTTAIAADWVLIFINNSGTFFYIDRESIRTISNGHKRAWMRIHFSQPIHRGVTSVRRLDEFDCRELRSRAIQSTFLKGETVDMIDNTPNQWIYAGPETAGESLLNYVCFGKLT